MYRRTCTSKMHVLSPKCILNFCTPHLTFELDMLGSKGCERMPLVSSCEMNTENGIKLFKNLWFSSEIFKKR